MNTLKETELWKALWDRIPAVFQHRWLMRRCWQTIRSTDQSVQSLAASGIKIIYPLLQTAKQCVGSRMQMSNRGEVWRQRVRVSVLLGNTCQEDAKDWAEKGLETTHLTTVQHWWQKGKRREASPKPVERKETPAEKLTMTEVHLHEPKALPNLETVGLEIGFWKIQVWG